jgi:exosortase
MKKNDLVKLVTLGAVTLIAYIPTIIWMVDRWREHDTYYSHGFLVPLISGYLVWTKRKQLASLRVSALASWGWGLFGAGIAIHLVSALLRVYFTSAFSMLLVLAGLILLTLGLKFLKALWFPLAFLGFMMPLPLVAIANISFRLKILAAQVSTGVVNALGIPAARDGSIIRTMHAYLAVEDPCSGIRSLIALIALGALMAYFTDTTRIKKVVLFCSAVPIAVGANVIRIVALTLAAEIYGSKFATGWFHDTMGIVVFVVAFAGLSMVGKLLE